MGIVPLITDNEDWFPLGETKLLGLASGEHISLWSEAGRSGYRLRIQNLNVALRAESEIYPIYLERKHFRFDAIALHDGRFVVAWTENDLAIIRYYDRDGRIQETAKVGPTSEAGAPIQLAVFPTGEVAIGCVDFLSIRTNEGLLLCGVSPDAWDFTMCCQHDGRLVRIDMKDERPAYYGGSPKYGLYGKLIDQSGAVLKNFALNVPATVVGDTYSHPDHLAMVCLTEGGFVVVWTQLGHTFGNSILAQIFDAEGKAQGTTVVVASAAASSTVNQPSVVLSGEGFMIAWSETTDSTLIHKYQQFNLDGSKSGTAIIMNSEHGENRGPVRLEVSMPSKVVGRWIEDNKIETAYVYFRGSSPSAGRAAFKVAFITRPASEPDSICLRTAVLYLEKFS